MCAYVVRPAQPRDNERIREIYNHAVLHTNATMNTVPRSILAQKLWLGVHDGLPYPALVACEAETGEVVGWGSLSAYIYYDGYRFTAENSVYVHPDWQGIGVGSVLLIALINEGGQRGFASLLALVTTDNTASLRLHEKYGFVHSGTLRRVGYKFDQWIDVACLQYLYPTLDDPTP